MFTKRIYIICLMFVIFGWLMGCHNISFSAVASDDTLTKKEHKKSSIKVKPFIYDGTKNYIYLTFDDGPQNGTMSCFKVCKDLGVKASFFMVGQHANSTRTKAIVDTIREAYPQILLCNHSTTHANGHYRYFYHHPQMAAEDFYKAQRTLQVPYKIIRLPGNSAWVNNNGIKATHLVDSTCILLNDTGYNIIGWDVEWSFNHKKETPVQSPQRMKNIVDSTIVKNRLHTKHHLVILSHDRMFKNQNYTDSLAKFINLLKQDPKNVFETVDHYPGVH